MPYPKTGAHFWIAGYELNHEDITTLLQIVPSKVLIKGEVIHGRVVQENFWRMNSSLGSETQFMDEHVKALVDQLTPRQQALAALRSQGCRIGINCFGYYANSPGFHLDRDLIVACATLELSLDFDLYCMTED